MTEGGDKHPIDLQALWAEHDEMSVDEVEAWIADHVSPELLKPIALPEGFVPDPAEFSPEPQHPTGPWMYRIVDSGEYTDALQTGRLRSRGAFGHAQGTYFWDGLPDPYFAVGVTAWAAMNPTDTYALVRVPLSASHWTKPSQRGYVSKDGIEIGQVELIAGPLLADDMAATIRDLRASADH